MPDSADDTFTTELVEPTPNELASQIAGAIDSISDCAPTSLAARCSVLQYQSSLHSSVVRVEAMVQLAMTKANGESPATDGNLQLLYDALSQTSLALFSDSPDDAQASTVWFRDRNFRLLNGVWRANACHLQRVLWVVETMPNDARFDEFTSCINALLTLSEISCDRANLLPHAIGNRVPPSHLSKADLIAPSVNRFSQDDLDLFGIDRKSLRPFIASSDRMRDSENVSIASSPMQRYPLVKCKTDVVLAMPTAVGVAIREFVVRFAIGNGMQDTFAKALANSYSHWLNDERAFGANPNNSVAFGNSPIGPLAELRMKRAGGEYAQLLFLVDNLDLIDSTDTVGPWGPHPQFSRILEERIDKCFLQSQAVGRYERGVTLIVTCGIGRTLSLPTLRRPGNNWYIETVDVDDLVHLSRTEEIDAFYLLKVLRARSKAETLGISFNRDIDFVNFIAFVRHHDGNVIPHSNMPEDSRHASFNIQIASDFIADLRSFSHQRTDMRIATRANGSAMRVRRSVAHISDFACLAPTYTSPVMTEAEVASVYVTPESHWWFVLCDQPLNSVGYERYQLLLTWLRRTIPVVQPLARGKAFNAVELHFRFTAPGLHLVDKIPETLPTLKEIENDIRVEIASKQNIISLTIGPKFEDGFGHATNVSELALVRQVIFGLAEWCGRAIEASEIERLAQLITGGPDGRHMHAMVGLTYRDGFAEKLNEEVVTPDQLDDGILNLGMAFRVESREHGRTIISGKHESVDFLNRLVRTLEDDLCERLRRLDRTDLIRKLVLNHERAVFRRNLWRRTSKANLAMHDDYPEALDTIVSRNQKYDSCIQPTRVVIEAATCECPIEGGLQAGDSDLSELMTLANSISIVGGWSDAIHLDAMKPELEITPLGKVLADPHFEEQILQPFYARATKVAISESAARQARSYPATHDRDGQAEREPKTAFEKAFGKEFGFPTKDIETLLIDLLGLGEEQRALTYEIEETELVDRLVKTQIGTHAQSIVDEFTLRSRKTWRIADADSDIDAYHQLSSEYKPKDTHAWKLRRKLSLLRRPIIELAPKRLLVIPGMIQDALAYTMNNYYNGAIRPQDLKSKEMATWKSVVGQERGTEFANRVADALSRLGWTTQVERKLTEIFGKKLERDFGDVDVLAYDPDSGRTLVIECKSLHYHKSHGEVAEQMSDWRGHTNEKGKRDDLRKHLDRVEKLLANPHQIKRYLKAQVEITVEPWLMFENPVPMLHAWENRDIQTKFTSFMDVESLFTRK